MDFVASAGPLGRRWIRATLELSDAVVVLSQGWRRQIEELAPRAEVRVLENAICIPSFPPRRSRQPGAACCFGYLGRLDTEKGVHEMLQAARTLADSGLAFRLTLAGPAGSAGDPASVSRAAAQMGLAELVQVIGPVAPATKDEFFAACDVYLQPSHFEGMPLALLEAMARGLPVIATKVGAIPEMVSQGGEGLLIQPGDCASLADAMRTLARDESVRTSMGTAARALTMRRFGVDRWARGVSQILRQAAC